MVPGESSWPARSPLGPPDQEEGEGSAKESRAERDEDTLDPTVCYPQPDDGHDNARDGERTERHDRVGRLLPCMTPSLTRSIGGLHNHLK